MSDPTPRKLTPGQIADIKERAAVAAKAYWYESIARVEVPLLLAHAAALEAEIQREREALGELLDALGEVNLCCADVDEKRGRCFTHRENLPCPYDWIREAQAKANAVRREVTR